MMKRLLFLFLLWAAGAYGQTLFRYENVLINQSGIPVVGASIWVCSGNVTPNFGNSPPCSLATVYSDLAGTIQISQPIISTTGSPTQTGSFAFVVASGTYTLAIKGAGLQASDLITVPNVSGTTTANNLTGPGAITGTFSGNPTLSGNPIFSGNPAFTGKPTAGNINNILAVDGTQYTSLATAFAACPSSGCTIDMRGNSTATSIGNFDAGTTPVTILLGPYTYSVGTITLEANTRIIGVGSTTLLANGTSNPVFTLSQTNFPQTNVYLSDFAVTAGAGNTTQNGFFLDCSAVSPNGGMWSSTFDRISMSGFNGVSFTLRGPNSGFTNGNSQFDTFNRLYIVRGTSVTAGEGIRVEGANSNISFYDATSIASTGTNGNSVYVGTFTGGSGGYPTTVVFHHLLDQNATTGVTLNGSLNVAFYSTHMEHIKTGAFLFTNGTFNINTLIQDGYFAADGSYVNAGNGYLLNVTSGAATNSVAFIGNTWSQFGAAPDNVLVGVPQTLNENSNYGWVNPTVFSGFGATTTLTGPFDNTYPLTFTINLGATVTTNTATISMHATAHGWSCTFSDITTPTTNLPRQSGGAANSVILTNYNAAGTATNPPANDVMLAQCKPY